MSLICLVIFRVIFCCFTMTRVHVGTSLDILARTFMSTELISLCCLCFLYSLLCFWCAYSHSIRNTHLDCCWHPAAPPNKTPRLTLPPRDKTLPDKPPPLRTKPPTRTKHPTKHPKHKPPRINPTYPTKHPEDKTWQNPRCCSF